jgi:beta-N-acetylhexosaminidase
VIVDHNGRAVPDGTVVRFIINNSNDVSAAQQIESITTEGIARASYKITSKGLMQIHVIAEPALTSAILQLDVPEDAGAVVVAMEPSPIPDSASETTPTPSPTNTPTESPTANGTGGKPGFLEWLLAIFTIAGGSLTAYFIGMRVYSIRWGIRWGLCTILAGLLVYLYLALDLPGGFAWLNLTGTSGLLLGILLFMALGWVIGFLWHGLTVRSSS